MKVARVFFYRIFFSCRSRLQNGLELAKITNLPVLYIPDEVPLNIVVPVKTATEAPVIALKEAPVMAAKPTGETVAVAEVVVPPPVQRAASLPKDGGSSRRWSRRQARSSADRHFRDRPPRFGAALKRLIVHASPL